MVKSALEYAQESREVLAKPRLRVEEADAYRLVYYVWSDEGCLKDLAGIQVVVAAFWY